MHPSITRALPDIRQLCIEGDVLRLEVFGSAAGNTKNDPGDVDFLVELHRRVDLVNPRTIRNPYFARSVNASRTPVYERASA
jgi:uncharacterized protein